MRIEKYFGAERETLRGLIAASRKMTSTRSGSNRTYRTKVFLFDEYALLKMRNIRLRNVVVQDRNLRHLESLAKTLLDLQAQGVGVVPILAFRSDGILLMARAKGAELYEKDRLDEKNYVLRRVKFLSNVPQAYYDKFAADAIKITDAGVLVDFVGKDNFFYDETVGFQFVDLDAHNDYFYGLSDQKPQSKAIAARICFLPCWYDTTPTYRETVSALLAQLTPAEHTALTAHNRAIFVKCRLALERSAVPEAIIQETLADERFIPQKQQVGLLP